MVSPQMIELIGSVAACLTTFAFLPQVVKVWRTKSVRDISLVTYASLTLGVFLWLLYGVGIKSIPVIVANGITFVLAASILVMKVRYSR
ncbi:SemiSWEET transporter [Desulfovibrio mangrovi]|uniref:SemiSWEET family sugar transporter n=1 Tax=Desulfovibrio mangrovi TaxID=2976983 RepID=UPI00224637C2|nr:SemiSWEET transporter [Desulfovibrio mangrovi]UZP66248.1 SemiSWEET transporter [Desulfovibrio mangrovi]